MGIDPEIATMLADLGEIAARNTAGAVNTRIRTVRAQKRHEETIAEFLSRETHIEEVRCICFNADSYSVVTEALDGLR